MEAKNRSNVPKIAPKPLRTSKKTERFQSASTRNLLLRGEIAVSSSLVKTILDAAVVTSRIFKNVFGLEVY